jgi:hypothetical protein
MTDRWTDRYMITSRTGRIYTRQMMISRCRHECGPGNGAAIRALVDDDGFMRRLYGQTPASVSAEVFLQIVGSGKWNH